MTMTMVRGRRRGGRTNGFANASKPPITLMTMEWQEEARRHDKERQQRVQTAKYINVETNDGAAGGGAVAGEGAAHDKR